MENKFLFLDTETTGNEPDKDRLFEVCYKIDGETKVALFKPPLPISVDSMAVTHVTNEMVADKPTFAGSQTEIELKKLLAEKILVAHNALFDIAILEAEGLSVPKFICTMRLARFFDPEAVIPKYNLQYLRYYLKLEVPPVGAHDAKSDVLTTEALFKRMWQKAKVELPDLSDDELAEKLAEISAQPSLIKRFTFGKYRDRDIAEVAGEDPGYLEWLLSQKENGEAKNEEDWIFTLRKHLGK